MFLIDLICFLLAIIFTFAVFALVATIITQAAPLSGSALTVFGLFVVGGGNLLAGIFITIPFVYHLFFTLFKSFFNLFF